jgi:signal transduction histidine kinase
MKDSGGNTFAICMMVEEVKPINAVLDAEKISDLEEQVRLRAMDLELANETLIEENKKRLISERELQSVKAKIEQSLANEMELNKLKTKFISMVSHEFRTPLTIIQTAAFLLEKSFERQDEEKFRKNLEKIGKSVVSMTELMENILNFGKLDQGDIRVSKQIFDIKHEILTLVQANNSYSKYVKLKLPKEPVFIDSDRILCNQIVNNLLSNAVKYSAPNPKIKLYLTADGYKCNISVVDNGIGIAKESIDSVVEAFKREDTITGTIWT